MRIRYFAAAAAAAGVREETVALGHIEADGGTLGALLRHLAVAHPPTRVSTGTARTAPSLERVLARSSFLVNGTNARDTGRTLDEEDMIDVLPPFAGG